MTDEIKQAVKRFDEMKKGEIIAELQKLGVDVNPNLPKERLIIQLKDAAQASAIPVEYPIPVVDEKDTGDTDAHSSKIMDMLETIVNKLDSVDKRVNKIETGGANEFKEGAKQEDIKSAEASKIGVDTRIVSIVEKTLGVDFGIEQEAYKDKPGLLITLLVPKRLSPVPAMFRPVRDNETGEYKVDPKNKRVVEEEYWPGDRRSVSVGSADSFEVIQNHCNRVRSFILMTYQKMNRPQPEFKIK